MSANWTQGPSTSEGRTELAIKKGLTKLPHELAEVRNHTSENHRLNMIHLLNVNLSRKLCRILLQLCRILLPFG